MIQLGKHLARACLHMFVRAEGNYYEYALHHMLSLSLIFFSYMMNFWMAGVMVLFLHDISDVFLIMIRAYMVLIFWIRILNIELRCLLPYFLQCYSWSGWWLGSYSLLLAASMLPFRVPLPRCIQTTLKSKCMQIINLERWYGFPHGSLFSCSAVCKSCNYSGPIT